MARTKKNETGPVADIVKSISYGTGLICAKVTHLGKTKEWKDAVSTTQDIVKNAGDAIKNNINEMKESFDEGVESIVDEANDTAPVKPRSRQKEDAEIEEVQVEEVEVVAKKEEPLTVNEEQELVQEAQEEIVTARDEEVIETEQEHLEQNKEAVVQDVKEVEAYPPLPAELEGAEIGEIDEDLMNDEDEAPKEKPQAAKAKKKVAKVNLDSEESLDNPYMFTVAEFKKDGKDPKGLMGSIKKNKPEISLTATDPLEWLNELLSSGDNGQPLKYDIQETPEIEEAYEAYETAEGSQRIQKLIQLNRLILEQAYPLKCPKIQAEEMKPKSRRSKSTDDGINLN